MFCIWWGSTPCCILSPVSAMESTITVSLLTSEPWYCPNQHQNSTINQLIWTVSQGKISCYKQCSGNNIYADTSFLCQLLCSMSDGSPKTENHTRDIAISDKTKVMMPEEFAERAGKIKVTVDLVSDWLMLELFGWETIPALQECVPKLWYSWSNYF